MFLAVSTIKGQSSDKKITILVGYFFFLGHAFASYGYGERFWVNISIYSLKLASKKIPMLNNYRYLLMLPFYRELSYKGIQLKINQLKNLNF